MAPDALDLLDAEVDVLKREVASYRHYIAQVRRLFPQLIDGSAEERCQMRQDAEAIIAAPRLMMPFYESMAREPSPGEFKAPPAYLVNETWACFRLMQVRMLFAIEHTHRWGANADPEVQSKKAFDKLEHDVHDQQYLIQGVLEGAFATEEKKLRQWFQLLRPDGELHGRTKPAEIGTDAVGLLRSVHPETGTPSTPAGRG